MKNGRQKVSSRQASAGMIVRWLRNERFPDTAMLNMKTAWRRPPTRRAWRRKPQPGTRTSQTAKSCTMISRSTPLDKTPFGRKCQAKERGEGFG
jgi:hypothetical protein